MRAASGWSQAGNGAQPAAWTADLDGDGVRVSRCPLPQNAVTPRRHTGSMSWTIETAELVQ